MNADYYFQQLVSYQKLGLKNWQNSTTRAQSLTFETSSKILDLSDWIPQENKAYVNKVQTYAKQALKRFNTYLDDAFSVYEKLFMSSVKQSSQKSKPTKQPQTEEKERK